MSFSIIDFFEQWLRIKDIGDVEDIEIQLRKLSSKELGTLLRMSDERLSGDLSPRTSDFNFIGDTQLSGLPVYCGEHSCRFPKLYSFARFSVLYADTSFVVNPFSYCRHVIPKSRKVGGRFLRNLSSAIFSTLSLRPLLEADIIRYAPFKPERFCDGCLMKIYSGESSENTYTELILEHFLQSSECRFAENDGDIHIQIDFDDSHDTHGLAMVGPQKSFDKQLVGQILSRDQIAQFKVFSSQAMVLSHEFSAKNILAHQTGADNIFSNSIELALVSEFSKPISNRPKIELSYPLLNSVSLQDALRIREQEWHHLSDFRTSIRKLKTDPQLDVGELSAIADHELSKIEKVVAKSRREATRDLVDSVPLGVLSIVAAVATSGLSAMIAAASAALGGGHAASKAIPAIRKRLETPEEARDSEYFYAWRVGRELNKH